MLKILKGDDTGGTFGRQLDVTINAGEGVSLDGCHAEFVFDGIVKTIPAPLVSGEARHVHFSHNETAAMRLGTRFAALRVVDAAGKVRTFANTIAVAVTDRVNEVYPGESSLSVTVRQAVSWDEVSGKPKLVKTINGKAPGDDGNINIPAGGTVKSATVNGGEKVTPDAQGNLALTVDVGGKVQSVNNNTPDANGNVTLTASDVDAPSYSILSQMVEIILQYITGNTDLINAHKNDINNPHQVTAEQVGTYDAGEIDDKINQFAAHYLTATLQGNAFTTVAALTSATAFYYAGDRTTPTKNDYAIVLNDGGKTARWAYFGETGAGEWQRQYYINETALDDKQWAAVNSGITADLVPKVLTVDETTATRKIMLNGVAFTSFAALTALVQKGVTRLRYYVTSASSRPVLYVAHLCDDSAIRFDATGTLGASVYTRSIAVTKTGEDGIAVSIGTLTEMAKKTDIPDVPEVSETFTAEDAGKAADAKAVGEKLAEKVDAVAVAGKLIDHIDLVGDDETYYIRGTLTHGEWVGSAHVKSVTLQNRINFWYGHPDNELYCSLDNVPLAHLINEEWVINDLTLLNQLLSEGAKRSEVTYIRPGTTYGAEFAGTAFGIDESALDPTLTQKGKAADAEKVGNALAGKAECDEYGNVNVRKDGQINFFGDPVGAGSERWLGRVTHHDITTVDDEDSTFSIAFPHRSGTFVVSDFNGAMQQEVENRITALAAAAAKYPLVTVDDDGNLTDCAINVTSAGSVTVPDDYTDLLIRATVTGSLSVTMPDGVTIYGDDFPAESGEYLVTITKIKDGEAFVKTLTMEVPNA